MKCLLFFLFFTSVSAAQPKPVKPIIQNDPEAEKYLLALKTKFNKLASYKLTYKIISTDVNNKSTSLNGTYIGSKDNYIIESKAMKIINDGHTQWNINHGEKEIQVNKVSLKKSKIETPMSIIKNYASVFKYRVREPIARNEIVLELIPLNKNSNFFKIDLRIQVVKLQIISTKLYDRGGNQYVYEISNTEENPKISLAEFSLNKDQYQDYEVLDLRD